MPLPVLPDVSDDASDTQRLVAFVQWVKKFLGALIEDAGQEKLGDVFVPSLLPAMKGAWEEGRQEFDRVATEVAELGPGQLRAHGLHGAQLRFKMATVAHWSSRILLPGSRPLIRRILDAIDTLLDSIIEAIPGGTAAKELKDAIRDSIDE